MRRPAMLCGKKAAPQKNGTAPHVNATHRMKCKNLNSLYILVSTYTYLFNYFYLLGIMR